MSGAISQQMIFPTYGRPHKGPLPPAALTYTMNWRGTSAALEPQQSNLTYTRAFQKAGALGTYSLNLGNVIRTDARVPYAQSMYVDNRRNGVDVRIQVEGTNVGFTAPAFSAGMYPLISDGAPIITFKVMQYPDGPTIVDIFPEAFQPFCIVDAEQGRARTISNTNCANVIAIPYQQLGIYGTLLRSITFGGVPQASGVYPILQPAITGRMLIKSVTYDVTLAINVAGGGNAYIALCEGIQDINGVWYINPIFQRYIINNSSAAGVYIQLGSQQVILDPPFMGFWQANPNVPVLDSVGNLINGVPSLVWVTASNNPSFDIYINTAVSVGTVLASPSLGTPQNIYGY